MSLALSETDIEKSKEKLFPQICPKCKDKKIYTNKDLHVKKCREC